MDRGAMALLSVFSLMVSKPNAQVPIARAFSLSDPDGVNGTVAQQL